MKHKNHYIENKGKESYNREKSTYIESLDKKLQIILQILDKIEANRSKVWERAHSEKKISKTGVARDGKKRSKLDKLIVELGRWVKKDKRKINSDITKENRKDFRLFRENIKKKARKNDSKPIKNHFNYTVVDKLLKNQNNTKVLVCELEQVRKKTKEFSLEKGFDSNALREKWAQVYAPLEKVQEEWFKVLDKDFLEEE
ncbi:9661_t:CDS:2 [Gigaspora margarita]|uniref:9661_t:CDS:1 n=1 Tax=Gigaspora margarita TaxID=4874 RepID=A0ABN7UW72_GIGMA|nr:9661_t:CDS:2 [Gigaspora margarita]